MVFRNIKVVLVITLAIGLISIIVYHLLFSPIFANNLKIIELRKNYIKLIDKYNFLKPAIIVLSQEKTGDKRYWYSLHGNIIKVDNTNVYLKGMNGNIYSFVINWQYVDDQNVQHNLLTKQSRNASEIFTARFNLNDINQSVINNKPYRFNDYYDVVWTDTRSLKEILQQSQKIQIFSLNTQPEQIRILYLYE